METDIKFNDKSIVMELSPYDVFLKIVNSGSLDEDGLNISRNIVSGAYTRVDPEEGDIIIEMDFDNLRGCSYEDRCELLLHELVHVKQFIEQITTSKLDDETEAYFLVWMYRKLSSRGLHGLNQLLKDTVHEGSDFPEENW